MKQVLDFLESLNEHDEWKPLNDVFKRWRCWFPPPQEMNRNMQKWGNFEREGGIGKMYFKTLWILIHDYVCLR